MEEHGNYTFKYKQYITNVLFCLQYNLFFGKSILYQIQMIGLLPTPNVALTQNSIAATATLTLQIEYFFTFNHKSLEKIQFEVFFNFDFRFSFVNRVPPNSFWEQVTLQHPKMTIVQVQLVVIARQHAAAALARMVGPQIGLDK